MNWIDDDTEFETHLRQFRPSRPHELKMPARRRWPARTWMAGAAVLGLLAAIAILRAPSVVRRPSAMNQTPQTSRQPRAPLFPLVEMTVYASAPPRLVGPGARVDASFPASPSRRVVSNVQPEYPEDAQRLGLEAGLDLRITVDREGRVTTTERLGGGTSVHRDDPNVRARAEFVATNANAFWHAAEAAARQWRFEPAQSAMTCVISFAFRLTASGDNATRRAASQVAPVIVPVTGSAQPGLQAPGGVVRVGGDVRPPRILVKANPVYPDEAKATGIRGVVLLEIRIAGDGSVSDVQVLRSIPMLDQAAIDAVKQWKYEPTLVGGVPVEVAMNVYVNF